jgi:amino acid adenylation domain-containing protein
MPHAIWWQNERILKENPEKVAIRCISRGGGVNVLSEILRKLIGDDLKSISYGVAISAIENIALALVCTFKVKENDIVALGVYENVEYVITLLGIVRSRAAFLPIDPREPESRISILLKESKPRLCVVYDKDKTRYKHNNVVTISELLSIAAGLVKPIEIPPPSPRTLVHIFFTSGSTGTPKGVIAEHRNLLAYVKAFAPAFHVTSSSNIFMASSFTFDPSVGDIFVSFFTGATLCIANRNITTTQLPRVIEMCSASHVVTTPALMSLFQSTSNNRLIIPPCLRFLALGGEAMSERLIRDWKNSGSNTRLFNVYGTTECVIYQTIFEHNAKPMTPIILNNIGRALSGTHLELINVGQDGVGEIVIKGDQVCQRGYLNRTELSSKKFIGDSYHTGDLGQICMNGTIRLLGRIDRQIKLNGRRVELGEIEHHFMSCKIVKYAAVVTRKRDDRVRIVAVVETNDDLSDTITSSLLRIWLNHHAPSFMQPWKILNVSTMPLTSSGKIDRVRVCELLEKQHSSSKQKEEQEEEEEESVLESDELTKSIRCIWCEVLNISRVQSCDHFFRLGGDSLNALRVCQLIQKRHSSFQHKSLHTKSFGELTGSLSVSNLLSRPVFKQYVQFLKDSGFLNQEGSKITDSESTAQNIKHSLNDHDHDDVEHKCLKDACIAGLESVVKILLDDLKIDPDVGISKRCLGITPLALAAQHGHVKICNLLIRYGASITSKGVQGSTPVHHAARGSSEVLSFMLDHAKAPIRIQDKNRQSLLHHAVRAGNLKSILVLKAHASKDTMKWLCEFKDRWSRTALHWAILNSHDNCTRYLLEECGALATPGSFSSIRRSRISHLFFETPLHIAIRRKSHDMIRLLLQHGANLDQVDDSNRSARDLLIEGGFDGILT